MKLKIIPSESGVEVFEVEVTKTNRSGCIIDYVINDKDYRGFQFDCHDRPSHYDKSVVSKITFHGFLIGRGKKRNILECYIKIIE